MHKTLFPGDDVPDFQKGNWWIAWQDEAAAAFCGIVYNKHSEGFLIRAGVLPAYRGQGLQKRLIRIRQAHAKRKGIRTLITYTTPNNAASCNSLISEGFRIYCPAHYWAGEEMVYWYKTL